MSLSLRRLVTLALEYALVAFTLFAALDASAVTGCITDEEGNPLRRVWVEHMFGSQRTNSSGCVTIDWPTPTVEVRVHAHNPVIRGENEWQWPISQVVRFSDGETVAIEAQGEWFRLIEHFRVAYNDGLREFEPWGAESPLGSTRTSDFLRVAFPEWLPKVVASYTEPRPTTPTALTNPLWFYPLAPLVHVLAGQDDARTAAHELGHALHFSRLPTARRMDVQARYLGWLLDEKANGGDATHCFERRTVPMVAFLEAFGLFAGRYWRTGPFDGEGPERHASFYEAAERMLRGAGDTHCEGGPERVLGADVEGAVFMALFVEFAKQPSVGLDYVVESYVSCQSLDVFEYGSCIRAREGAASAVYLALRAATETFGIWLDPPTPVEGASEASDRFAQTLARGDFDGDGKSDLAIGVPDEDVGSLVNAGAVSVLYGSSTGLSAIANQIWSFDSSGVPGVAAANDRLGSALAAGDLNADGYDDLAIGAGSDDVGVTLDAGSVLILYGSANGLAAAGAQHRHEDAIGVSGVVEASDGYGTSLAIGDFDRDGFSDLAAGVPRQDVAGVADAGAVNVSFGSSAGLSGTRASLVLQQATLGLGDVRAEANDRFGTSLTSCDFDGDGRADLAVGVPAEDLGALTDAGAVQVHYGTAGGLGLGSLWHQNSSEIAEDAESFDRFGSSLACGEFNGDPWADLAVGVPDENLAVLADAGVVHVLHGAPGGLVASGSQLWHQDRTGLADIAESGDRFGAALAAGDVGEDPLDDLLVGVPGEDWSTTLDAGAVAVLFAGDLADGTKLGSLNNRLLAEPSSARVAGDAYGTSLVIGDFDGDVRFAPNPDRDRPPLDFAAGTPGDDPMGQGNAGSLRVHYGVMHEADALQAVWHQSR